MKIKYLLYSVLTTAVLSGCIDVLDKKDLSAITEKDVWNNAQYATAYLNKLYRDNLPGWDQDVAGYSDEAYGETGILYGHLTTTSIDNWPYKEIRNINIMLSSIETGNIDNATKTSLKAQALVLRAWRYFQMVRLYGGVPMILEPQALTDDLYVTRNKTSECINLIIKDLDDAIDALPWKWTGDDEGRFTKATVMALKGRILLYYASPQFNQCWKIIPKTNTEGEFWGAGVLGTVTDGDTATEGTLTTNNPQAGMITQAGMYRMTLDMMEYTYTLEELGFAPYIYEIGNNTSWSGTCPLAGINFDGKYRGFAYLNGEFKYKPNPEKDNWTGDWEKVSGDALAGTLDENGAGNIDAPEAGFYMMEVDLTAMTYKHTLISTLGVIGSATPSGWDADTDMTYNEEDGSWNLTTNLTDGEIKIRANNDWDINWGGSIAEPTFNAGNIAVTAGNYTIRFIPQCDGMNLLTLTKN